MPKLSINPDTGNLDLFGDAAANTVVSGGSSTDEALSRWDGTTGTLLQDSTVIVTDAGEMTNASQPAFMARVSVTISNITGDGTVYQIIFNTERFDQGSDYDTVTGLFTAPVTGKYQLNTSVRCLQPTGQTVNTIFITTSNNQVILADFDGNNYKRSNDAWALSGGHLMDMDAADTSRVQVQVQGGALDVDILGGTTVTYFSGALIC